MTKRTAISALTAAYLCIASISVSAASFPCDDSIDNHIDKAICTNTQLSELDKLLYDVYKTSLIHLHGSAGIDIFKEGQRRWVRAGRNQCRNAKSVADCLIPIYQSRIDELLVDSPVPSERRIRIVQASERYDFQLEFVNLQASDEGPDRFGRIVVYEKGSTTPLQHIPMSRLYVAVDDDNRILHNTAIMYGEQGTINVGDFNFDGQEDLAIRNGNNGSYGAPSYDVFLFSKRQARLIKSPALTELIESTLGMFGVHPDKRRVSTWAKSGCCWHQYTEYEIRKDAPVAVYRMTETPEDIGNDDLAFSQTHEVLKNGKWETVETKQVAPK